MATKTPDLTELGASGLRHSRGYVQEEYQRDLQGSRGAKVFDEMSRSDPIAGAALEAITKLVLRTSARADPDAASSREDQESAELVWSALNDCENQWTVILERALSSLTYGWAWHEEVYKIRSGESVTPPPGTPPERQAAWARLHRSTFNDGRIGWASLAHRAPTSLTRWDLDDGGRVQGMYQSAAPTYREILIPREKSAHFVVGAGDANPEGRSILRRAYRPWFLRKRIEEFEAIGIERQGPGLPVFRVPSGWLAKGAADADKAMLATISELGGKIRRNQVDSLVIPLMYDRDGRELFKFGFEAASTSRVIDTDKSIARYAQWTAMAMLADFILLGHDGSGSRALGGVKAEVFFTACEAVLRMIADELNAHSIPRLLALNGMKGRCKLVFGDVDRPNLNEIGGYIQATANAGTLYADDEIGRWTRKLAGMPEDLAKAMFGKRRDARKRSFPPAARGEVRERVAKADGGDADADDHDPAVRVALKLAGRLRRAFLGAIRRLQGRVDMEALESALASRDADAAEAALALEHLPAEMESSVTVLRTVFRRAGVATAAEVVAAGGAGAAFSTPTAAEIIRARGAALVTNIDESTRAAVRARLADALEAGQAPRAAARAIAEHVGQSERDSAAIARFEAAQREEGLSEKEVASRTRVYARRKLQDRGETIAEHEALEAAGAARAEAWRQASEAGHLPPDVRRGVLVAVDERACSICRPLADPNITFGLNEEIVPGRKHTPLHVRCRCGERLVWPAPEA